MNYLFVYCFDFPHDVLPIIFYSADCDFEKDFCPLVYFFYF